MATDNPGMDSILATGVARQGNEIASKIIEQAGADPSHRVHRQNRPGRLQQRNDSREKARRLLQWQAITDLGN